MPAPEVPAESLFEPGLAERVLTRALARGGDFAELYAERASSFSVSLDDRKLERAQSGQDLGAAVRVIAGDSTYFGHVDGLGEQDLERLADGVAAAVKGGSTTPGALSALDRAPGQSIEQRPEQVAAERKADMLRECDERARGRGAEIVQVSAGYTEDRSEIQIANSEGLLAADDRTRVRLGVQVVARQDDRVETGMETLAGHRGFELFEGDFGVVADEASRRALTMLDAQPAPAGPMTVVVGNGFGGVLFHEATGHGLEADAIQKNASVYSGQLGKRVAGKLVTAYDDGSLAGEWGTDGIDDEGTPTQSTRVIDEGTLGFYLYDLTRSRKDGTRSTGNGRRQSFRHLPIPRMTNTYIAPGDADPEDIIGDVKRGVFAVSFAGGQVEPATGNFVFGVSEGYLIEQGKVTTALRGMTLLGSSLDVLQRIDAVGNDLAFKSGFCGKDGQRVPVGTGQPTVRISELTVGALLSESSGELDLERAARLAIDAAGAAGADEADAWCEQSVSLNLRVYEAAVENLTEATTRGVGVRAFVAGRTGYAYGSDLGEGALKALAAAATEAAAVTEPDEHAGLPENCGSAEVPSLCSPEFQNWTTERKVEIALAVESAARTRDALITNVEDTIYADTTSRVVLANSRGFSGAYEQTFAYSYAYAFAGEGADLMTGLGVGTGRGPEELDPEAIGRETADRALALHGARQPKSRRCPVVLDPYVAASFASIIGGTLSARAVQRGRSLFAGRQGEQVADPELRLADDGLEPKGLATAPFDGEGVPHERTVLIDEGRLESFLYDRYTAHVAGGRSTGNGTRSSYRSAPSVGTTNLVASAGGSSTEELIRTAGEGFYVMDVSGLHSGVNPASGTFSVGASGRLIEGGELAAPAREVTIASDIVSMLLAVQAVGSDTRWLPFGGSVKTPPLLIGDMTVGGA